MDWIWSAGGVVKVLSIIVMLSTFIPAVIARREASDSARAARGWAISCMLWTISILLLSLGAALDASDHAFLYMVGAIPMAAVGTYMWRLAQSEGRAVKVIHRTAQDATLAQNAPR